MVDAWQKLWNLLFKSTDTKKSFVNGEGVALFLKCLDKFPENTALIHTMLGCMACVTGDSNLVFKMMTHDFAQRIIDLADTPDFTDLSFCAINVLCTMLKEGKTSWRKTKLSFTATLVKFNSIYDRWDISNVKTSLGTSNFEDEFSYLASDVPQVHLHGLWTIACYTRQSNSTCIRINLTH